MRSSSTSLLRHRQQTGPLQEFGLWGWLLIVSLGHVTCLSAGDWPQILGPNRNGVAVKESLTLDWPEQGPAVKWQQPVGRGVAGVAVKDGRVVLFHRVDDEEVAVCFQAETGRELWKRSFPATFRPRIVPDDGPLCVPVLHEERVLLFGAAGDLHCLELTSGRLLWSRATHADYGADEGYFGAGSSPLVFENLVLVNVGGFRQNAGVVAFALDSGKTVWQSGAWQASYASPVLTTLDSKPVALFITRVETVGLNPRTGDFLYSTPFGQRGPTVNGANPVVRDGHLFLTASYGIGNLWAKLNADKMEVLREEFKPLASQYTTPIPVGPALIGVDGRQDGPAADLVSFDPVTGKEFWRKAGFGYATLIRAGDFLLIMKTDGELVIAKADAQAYQELKRASLMNTTTRALPALANGRLYLRDEQSLKCFQISQP